MKDKPIYIPSHYFLNTIVHYEPSKAKRKARVLNKTNLDNNEINQLRLQKRHRKKSALVACLVSKLKHNEYHLIRNNAFSSIQLATDLKLGSVDNIRVPRTMHTRTQVVMTKKGSDWHASFANTQESTHGWTKKN